MSNYNNLLKFFKEQGSISDTEIAVLNESLNKIPQNQKAQVEANIEKMSGELLALDNKLSDLEKDERFKDVLTETQINHTFRILQYNTLFNYILNLVPECDKIISKMVNDLNKNLINTNSLIARKIRMRTKSKGGIYIDRNQAFEHLSKIIEDGIESLSSLSQTTGPKLIINNQPSPPSLSNINLNQGKINPLNQTTSGTTQVKTSGTTPGTTGTTPGITGTTQVKTTGTTPGTTGTTQVKTSGTTPGTTPGTTTSKYLLFGGSDVNLFKDTYLEQRLKKLVKIYNTDVMLKVANIISDKETFEKFFKKIYSVAYEVSIAEIFLNNFFIEISNEELIKFLDLSSNIERDTLIVNNILGDRGKKYILVSQFVNKLARLEVKSLKRLILTDEILSELGFILESVVEKVKNLRDVFENIKNQTDLITMLYDDNLRNSKRVFTYVKKRLNTVESNRFKFTNLENNSVLKLDYINTPNDNNNLPQEKETYYFGSFDNIFDTRVSNDEVAKEIIKDLGRRIEKKEDICIIGYGASGAGKTSTLVRLTKTGQDGIIIELLKLPEILNKFKKINLNAIEILINPENNPTYERVNPNQYSFRDLIKLEETLEIFDYLGENNTEVITGTSITLNKNATKEIKNQNYTLYDDSTLKFDVDRSKLETVDFFQSEISFIVNNVTKGTETTKSGYYLDVKDDRIKSGKMSLLSDTFEPLNIQFNNQKGNWVGSLRIKREDLEYFKSDYNFNLKQDDIVLSKDLGDYITHLLSLRKEKPTPNNPNSSRSHVVIKLDLFTETTDTEKASSIILCDFAGVENQFLCEDETTLQNFINAYKKSDVKFPFSQFKGSNNPDPKVRDELFKFVNDARKTVDCETVDSEECTKIVNSRLAIFCNQRLREGFLINHSLGDMRTDIKELMLSSIKGDKTFLPIFSDTSIYPYCRNLFLDSEYFSIFYDATDAEYQPIGQIVKLFERLKIDVKKLIFVLFTVINLNAEANNPPPVPYFNVSPLIYYLQSKNSIKISEEFEKLKAKIISYKNEPKYVNFISSLETNFNDAETLANAVKKTNAATLIGSLESTVMLQSLTFSQFSCNKMPETEKPEIIDFLQDKGFPIDLTTEQKYFKKYLKYKQKYQSLKNKMF
jgi:hypothetical protein